MKLYNIIRAYYQTLWYFCMFIWVFWSSIMEPVLSSHSVLIPVKPAMVWCCLQMQTVIACHTQIMFECKKGNLEDLMICFFKGRLPLPIVNERITVSYSVRSLSQETCRLNHGIQSWLKIKVKFMIMSHFADAFIQNNYQWITM